MQLRQILAVASSEDDNDDNRYCGNYQVEMFNCWIPGDESYSQLNQQFLCFHLKALVAQLIHIWTKNKMKIYFLAFHKTNTDTAPIMPASTTSTCNGNPPVAVVVPSGAFAVTYAISEFPLLDTVAKPPI